MLIEDLETGDARPQEAAKTIRFNLGIQSASPAPQAIALPDVSPPPRPHSQSSATGRPVVRTDHEEARSRTRSREEEQDEEQAEDGETVFPLGWCNTPSTCPTPAIASHIDQSTLSQAYQALDSARIASVGPDPSLG